MLDFSMLADVKFNREIDKDKDDIFVGGYAMVMGDELIEFDFTHYEGNVDKQDLHILHIECYYPDADCFPQLEAITEDMLKNVKAVREFCFDIISEDGQSLLHPVSLEKLHLMYHMMKKSQLSMYSKVL